MVYPLNSPGRIQGNDPQGQNTKSFRNNEKNLVSLLNGSRCGWRIPLLFEFIKVHFIFELLDGLSIRSTDTVPEGEVLPIVIIKFQMMNRVVSCPIHDGVVYQVDPIMNRNRPKLF
jgi:hypothetical protein